MKHCTIHNKYADVLINDNQRRHKMNTFLCKNHNMHLISVTKLLWFPINDKRYKLDDGITSYSCIM